LADCRLSGSRHTVPFTHISRWLEDTPD
jgi:hypothetical protein